MDLKRITIDFLQYCREYQIELYNEPGLQHEFAIYLRDKLKNTEFKVQLERNVSFFDIVKASVRKREIDIVIYNFDKTYKAVIELKYSKKTQGKVPERMFEVCEDIMFLEQMKTAGFNTCISLFIADNKDFWNGSGSKFPYSYFRPPFECLCGIIKKPTGSDEKKLSKTVELKHKYNLVWHDLDDSHKYILTEVTDE